MNSSMTDEVEFKTQSDRGLLPKDRTILEREVMEYRPFGLDEQGYTIRSERVVRRSLMAHQRINRLCTASL